MIFMHEDKHKGALICNLTFFEANEPNYNSTSISRKD